MNKVVLGLVWLLAWMVLEAGAAAWTPGKGPAQEAPLVFHSFSDPNLMLAGTNSGIYLSTDAGRTWGYSNQGLAATNRRVSAFIELPSGWLVVATAGGVYRSPDRGANWLISSTDMSAAKLHSFVLRRDGLLFGAASDALYWSRDNGASWSRSPDVLPSGASNLLKSSKDGLTWYAAGINGVYVSADNGKSWVSRSNMGGSGFVTALAVAPDGSVYAGLSDGGIWRSADQGKTWSKGNGDLIVSYVTCLLVTAKGTVFAGSSTNGLYRSVDNGLTWQAVSQGDASPEVVSLGQAGNGNVLVGKRALLSGAASVLVSNDEGKSWTSVEKGFVALPVSAMSETADGTLYAGTPDGVYLSRNGGKTWESASQGISLDQVIPSWRIPGIVALAKTADNGLIAMTPSGRFFLRESGAVSWTAVGKINASVATMRMSSDGTLWAALETGKCAEGKCVYRSADKGKTWTPSATAFSISFLAAVTTDEKNAVYVAGAGAVYRSADQGKTWEAASQGLPAKDSIISLLATAGRLYAGTAANGVFVSDDGGAVWTAVGNELKNLPVLKLISAPDGTLYAGTKRGLYKSLDRGASWVADMQGLADLNVIDMYVGGNGTLYASTYAGGSYFRPLPDGTVAGLSIQAPGVLEGQGKIKLTALATFENGAQANVKPIWSVSDAALASIDADGNLTYRAGVQDSRLEISARYTNQQTASHTMVLRTSATVRELSLDVPAGLPGGASILPRALALYADGAWLPVPAEWQVSGPARLDSENGILTGEVVGGDTPIQLTASYGGHSAVSTLTLRKARSATALRILGPRYMDTGQRARFQAKLIYDDGSETLVTPSWSVRGTGNSIMPNGELLAGSVPQLVELLANYSDGANALTSTFPIRVLSWSSSAHDVLTIRLDVRGDLYPGDNLRLRLGEENFDPLTRYDLYAVLQTPAGAMIFLKDTGKSPVEFSEKLVALRSGVSFAAAQDEGLLDIVLPNGLEKGTYAGHAVAVKAGSNPFDSTNWLSYSSSMARAPGISSVPIVIMNR